jgi:hypothetical protein
MSQLSVIRQERQHPTGELVSQLSLKLRDNLEVLQVVVLICMCDLFLTGLAVKTHRPGPSKEAMFNNSILFQ